MEGQDELVTKAHSAASFLGEQDAQLRVVAHYDCDGIASAIIVHQAFQRAGIPFELTFVEELNADNLEELAAECHEQVWLFVDIGSGQLDAVEDVLDTRQVVIADHHEPAEGEVRHHINPHEVGIDGGEHISGAGVTYLVMRCLDSDNKDLVKYALVGANGDIQVEADEYLGLNAGLMEDAVDEGVITRKQGLRLYGRTRKTLVEALKYTTDPYLPGITNNESGAVQFLGELDIPLRTEDGMRSLADLSPEEEQALVHGLITRGYDVEDLIGDIYILDNGWEIGEYASLLNACGRLGRPHDGIRVAVEEDRALAEEIKTEYGRRIGRYLGFVEDNLDNDDVVRRMDDGAAIVAGDSIEDTMIGTITTIAQRSEIVDADVLVGLAHRGEDHVKVSARARGAAVEDGLQMNELMDELCTVCEGEGGGHEAAAGGKIPRSEQTRFIKMLREVLDGSGEP